MAVWVRQTQRRGRAHQKVGQDAHAVQADGREHRFYVETEAVTHDGDGQALRLRPADECDEAGGDREAAQDEAQHLPAVRGQHDRLSVDSGPRRHPLPAHRVVVRLPVAGCEVRAELSGNIDRAGGAVEVDKHAADGHGDTLRTDPRAPKASKSRADG